MAEHEGGGGGGILRELLAVFGFDVDTEELAKSETKLERYFQRIERMATAFAGVFVAHEIFEFAEANVHAMTEIEHASARLGIATENVQQYQFAAKSMGLSGDELLNMMGRLQVSQEQAIKSGGEGAKAFAAIGISLHDIKGKDANEVFRLVADGIAKQTDASKRAATAQALFGRGGRALLPILAEGSEGLDKLNEEYAKLGGGYSEEAIERSKDFEHESAKLNLSLTALKSKAMEKLLPILTKIVDGFTKAVTWIRQMTKDSFLLQSALGVLAAVAGVFAIEMAIANAPLLLITAAIAGLILLIDDFVTMMAGGESVIGDTIDKIFGKDAHLETVKELRDLWANVKDIFVELWREVKMVWDAFKWMKDNLGAIGGGIGDALAKGRNKAIELTAPATAPGKLTYEQRVAAEQGRRLVESRITGEAFKLTEIPKSFKGHEAAFQADVAQWAAAIQGGQFPQFAPRVAGPENAPVQITQTINPSPGMDEKQLGEHAAKAVHEVIKQRNRAAASTLQRKTAQ